MESGILRVRGWAPLVQGGQSKPQVGGMEGKPEGGKE